MAENNTSYQSQHAFNEANLINNIIDRRLIDLNTFLPCKIVAVNADGTYDIQPIINGLDVQNNPITPNIIHEVPIAYEVAGAFAIKYAYSVNDVVLAGFCQRNMDNVKLNGWQTKNPANFRLFDIADAIIIRGIKSASASKATIEIDNNGKITVTTNDDINLSCNNAKVTADGDINIDAMGDVDITSESGNIKLSAFSSTIDMSPDSIGIDSLLAVTINAPTMMFGKLGVLTGTNLSTPVGGGPVNPPPLTPVIFTGS